jgi:hypothetical protein
LRGKAWRRRAATSGSLSLGVAFFKSSRKSTGERVNEPEGARLARSTLPAVHRSGTCW